MGTQGEVSLQEVMALIETAREYLGPMWVKKSMKAAANLPLRGVVNRAQLTRVHPLGLLFREVEKNQESIQKGKPLANASTLLLLAGLGRNLKSLEAMPGFAGLLEQLKQPGAYGEAALLTEVAAHWLKLGYTIRILEEERLGALASHDVHTFYLQAASYTFLPGKPAPDGAELAIPGNFIYSNWWEAWTANAAGSVSVTNSEVQDIIQAFDRTNPHNAGPILYLDLPPYATQENFQPILATAANKLQGTTHLSAIVLCLPQHLPHLYVRHTLPVYAENCTYPLPKSLLNTLSY